MKTANETENYKSQPIGIEKSYITWSDREIQSECNVNFFKLITKCDGKLKSTFQVIPNLLLGNFANGRLQPGRRHKIVGIRVLTRKEITQRGKQTSDSVKVKIVILMDRKNVLSKPEVTNRNFTVRKYD